jgi:tetraprenyl-beta-curcumene synthase
VQSSSTNPSIAVPGASAQVRTGPSETGLTIRAGAALVGANFRYWSRIAPQVRRELRRWSKRASAIPDPRLRAIATGKLRAEHFNAQVAATLATTVPRRHRSRAVEAIVALEVLYDYLDGVTEAPATDPLRDRTQAYRAFTAIFDVDLTASDAGEDPHVSDGYAGDEYASDGGYVRALGSAVKAAVATLPSSSAVASAGRRAAERCASAQVRVHATTQLGADQLEQWARERAAVEQGRDWREYLAGAVASVLCVHALIAAAGDDALGEDDARAIDAAYLSISALSTLLDSLIDHERDVHAGDPWLVRLYGDPSALGAALPDIAERAVEQVRLLPKDAHHVMTLSGVVAYYGSAPAARHGTARPSVLELQRELRPVILPTLAVMRAWRLAKSVRSGRAGHARP